jgi:hypothetical protein
VIYLCCSSNAPYLPRIRPYLESVERHVNPDVQPVLVAVDCQPAPEYLHDLARWGVLAIPRGALTIAPPLDHVQNGDFVRFLPGKPDDVIIFTDGDVVMQRGFTADEIAWMRSLAPGEVAVGWNAGPEDTLLSEGERLRPHVQLPNVWLRAVLPDGTIPPIYNTGVIIARRDTWQRWHRAFVAVWPWAQQTFQHYAAQQWALCWALAHTPGLRAVLLGHEIHTHGCYPLPEGAAFDSNGLLTYQGETVVFKHHL